MQSENGLLGLRSLNGDAPLPTLVNAGGQPCGIVPAMDLVTGARRVIVAMEHCTKEGQPKILPECSLPLTCKGRVETIVTELALFRIRSGVLVPEELGPDVSIEALQKSTPHRSP